jgi:hypothetical protein
VVTTAYCEHQVINTKYRNKEQSAFTVAQRIGSNKSAKGKGLTLCQRQKMGKTQATPKAQARATAATKGDLGKRLKAKVGKRAPKAANYTDTAFKTAYVKVKPQDSLNASNKVSNVPAKELADGGEFAKNRFEDSTELISSRGNTFDQLSFQFLHHHAPAARISAIKGILDALQQIEGRQQSPLRVIEVNLSSLFPILSKSFVDTDDTVRQIARDAQKIIYDVLVHANNEELGKRVSGIALLEPFLPLHVAYLSSAFNSLLSTVRQDALEGVVMTTSFFLRCVEGSSASPQDSSFSFSASSVRCHIEFMERLLPSYGRLFSAVTSSHSSSVITAGQRIDQMAAVTTKKTRGGRKKRSKSDKGKGSATPTASKNELGRRFQILRSLFSLLKWNKYISFCDTSVGTTGMSRYPSELCAMSRNANCFDMIYCAGGKHNLLVNRGAKNRANRRIISPMRSLENISNIGSTMTGWQSAQCSQIELPAKVCHGILKTLCDGWVELVQRGHTHGEGVSLHHMFVEEAMLLVSVIRYFWTQICCPIIPAVAANKGNIEDEELKLLRLTEQLYQLLLEAFPIKDDSGNSTSLSLCNSANSSLCCFFGEIAIVVPSLGDSWVEPVLEFIFLRLGFSGKVAAGFGSSDEAQCEALDVASLLLRKSSLTEAYLLNKSSRVKLLECLQAAFFDRELDQDGSQRALTDSKSEKRACDLLCNLLIMDDWAIGEGDKQIPLALTKMAKALPYFLCAAGEACTSEMDQILHALKHVCSRLSETGLDGERRALEDSIRQNIALVLRVPKVKKSRLFGVPVFETSSRTCQQSIIAFIAYLEYPPKNVTDALGTICWRLGTQGGVSNEIVTSIHEVLFKIRRTIPFEAYVNFLVQSSVLGARKSPRGLSNDMAPYGCTTQLLCQSVLRAGPAKVLSAIQPVIQDCLDTLSCESKHSLLRLQSCLVLFAAWYIDGAADGIVIETIRTFVAEDKMIDKYLTFCFSLESKSMSIALLRPLFLILSHDCILAKRFLEKVLSRQDEGEALRLPAKTTKKLRDHLEHELEIAQLSEEVIDLLNALSKN